MSFKDYINEQQQILDEHEQSLDEGRIVTKRYIDKNGTIQTRRISTDPKEKVINHKDGTFNVKKITDTERANLERRKGVKGTKSRRKQKKHLKKHYDLLGGPVRGEEGDHVYKRDKQNGAVQSDLNARKKRHEKSEKRKKWKKLKKAVGEFAKKALDTAGKALTGGPSKIWNG